MTAFDRFTLPVIFVAGLVGAAGVALAAAGAHLGGALIGPASTMCLAHAPAMLALAALSSARLRTAIPSALLLGIGTLLFSGDLTFKQFYGESLFPMAAPTGGMMVIIGWLVAAVGVFLPPRT
ncbi:DUF423 domain-containing protein [Rhizobium halophytocola]|uniref:Uncharacterized membrane protein YgdD (TMEM256/DUF423 family) n=1 Tax=Rhizobium halophytocola TaxID=735519 RepID=A0ABS4DSI2_9HYPH|nr:DUF423 domain-containing protein [Rhizobium halophytocola]MBP1848652.1 uncharacterized membrane protein YgdD (TMEM256/DUF423 family) [Rhizobium halophytocola]